MGLPVLNPVAEPYSSCQGTLKHIPVALDMSPSRAHTPLAGSIRPHDLDAVRAGWQWLISAAQAVMWLTPFQGCTKTGSLRPSGTGMCAPASVPWKGVSRSAAGFKTGSPMRDLTRFYRPCGSGQNGLGPGRQEMTSSSRPTFVNASIARSRCSRVWAAETCTRIRASLRGTTGKKKPMT